MKIRTNRIIAGFNTQTLYSEISHLVDGSLGPRLIASVQVDICKVLVIVFIVKIDLIVNQNLNLNILYINFKLNRLLTNNDIDRYPVLYTYFSSTTSNSISSSMIMWVLNGVKRGYNINLILILEQTIFYTRTQCFEIKIHLIFRT